jgi:hypothetical protein
MVAWFEDHMIDNLADLVCNYDHLQAKLKGEWQQVSN